MVTSIDVKFIFDSARLGLFIPANILQTAVSPFELSSCCSCHILAIILPSSYYWNEWNVRHFCFHNQNNSTSSLGLLG